MWKKVEMTEKQDEELEAQHIFSRAIQFGGSSLGVKREEMISVLVGSLLKCSY